MIYSSTFLIDRLYSQTYISNADDSTKDLAKAVRIGREAVDMAEKRYNMLCEKQNAASRVEDKGWCRNGGDCDDKNAYISPPPIKSLFANDALRFVHARLALGKALALLAQHVEFGASDLRMLGILPNVFTEVERRQIIQQSPPILEHHRRATL